MTEPRRRFQVFISSTYEDLQDIRSEIIEQLFRTNCIPVGMEMFPASNRPAWEIIKKMIDDSDCVVLILAKKYGSLDSSGISYTEKEFDYANPRKPVLVFPQRLTAAEEDALDEEMRRFRAKAIFGRHVGFWETAGRLLAVINSDLHMELNENRHEGWVRGGYAMNEHVGVLKKTVSELTSNLETQLSSVPRIHELSETINNRVDAIFSLATADRRGVEAMSDYIAIQRLKLKLRERNPVFEPVADGLLRHPFATLAKLANCQASVPVYQIGHANELLIDAITSRFDAVSNDDLKFWRSTDYTNRVYRDAISDAVRRPAKPIIATRIFIFSHQELVEQSDKIADVLSEQMREGMQWAVAVEEDEKRHRPIGAKPDFALFDHDRVVSYFRTNREFHVTFHCDETAAEFDLQIREYMALLTQCWVATAGFAQNHLAAHDEASLLARVAARTAELRKLNFEHADRLFPLIVETEAEIRLSLDRMLELRTKVMARR